MRGRRTGGDGDGGGEVVKGKVEIGRRRIGGDGDGGDGEMGRYGRGEGLEVLLAGVKELQAWKTH